MDRQEYINQSQLRQTRLEGIARARLGMGHNSVTGNWHNLALEDSGDSPQTEFAWQGSIDSISTRTELRERLDLEVGSEFPAFGGTGSAKAKFSRDVQVVSESAYMLLTCKVVLKRFEVTQARFDKAALDHLKSSTRRTFLQIYGDRYCKQVDVGGEFYALIQFFTYSKKENEYLRAEVKASGGVWDASGTLEKKIERFFDIKRLNIVCYVHGAIMEMPTLQTAMTQAINFPNIIKDSGGADVNYRFMPYSAVINRPQNVPNLDDAKNTLVSLVNSYNRSKDLLDETNYCISRPIEFDQFDIKKMQDKNEICLNSIVAISDTYDRLAQDPYTENLPPVPKVDESKILPLPDRIIGLNLPLDIQIRIWDGSFRYAKGGEEIGRPAETEITSIQARTDIPGITLFMVMTYNTRVPGDDCGNNPCPIPSTAFSARFNLANGISQIFPAGIVGFLIELDGPRKEIYGVRYTVRTSPGNGVFNGKDGEAAHNHPQWGKGMSTVATLMISLVTK